MEVPGAADIEENNPHGDGDQEASPSQTACPSNGSDVRRSESDDNDDTAGEGDDHAGDNSIDEGDEEGNGSEDEDEEPRFKYANLTKKLGSLYRNGDATSSLLTAGDKMVCDAFYSIVDVADSHLF